MEPIAFDTLEFVETMSKAGMDADTAKALARANRNAFAQILEQKELASRHDLELGMARLREEIRADIQRSHNTMLSWVAGLIVAQTTFIVTALAWLLK